MDRASPTYEPRIFSFQHLSSNSKQFQQFCDANDVQGALEYFFFSFDFLSE